METGKSYVKENGFGHEEWLFNYEWCLNGYKYGFLQPFNQQKYRDLQQGINYALALYTKHLGRTFLVATIQNAYIPTRKEIQTAFTEMRKKGWIKQMRDDVKAVQGNADVLSDADSQQMINIRFRLADVILYDPMPVFQKDHLVSRTKRYTELDWDGKLPVTSDQAEKDPTRSESQQIRAAQQATVIEPQHVRLQNRLFETLKKQFGDRAVKYENDFVDLKVRDGQGEVFYEIKTETTAKKCIRNAIGQIMEYATYPNAARSYQWVIVGDSPPTEDDRKYLDHLRLTYRLPVYYAQFNWETQELGRQI